MKQVTNKIFFFLFLISLLVTSCSEQSSKQSNRNCINYIIAKDDSLANIRNHACATISLSETIENYVNSIEKLNFENCPKSFTDSFDGHLKAWKNMIEVTDKYPNIRGEMHDLFKDLENGPDSVRFKTLLDEIWDTWSQLEDAMKAIENEN